MTILPSTSEASTTSASTPPPVRTASRPAASRPSTEAAASTAAGAWAATASASASTRGAPSMVCAASVWAAWIRAAPSPPSTATVSGSSGAAETVTATGVPSRAATASRPRAEAGTCPVWVSSMRTTMFGMLGPLLDQPLGGQEIDELRGGGSLVNDLAAGGPRGALRPGPARCCGEATPRRDRRRKGSRPACAWRP